MGVVASGVRSRAPRGPLRTALLTGVAALGARGAAALSSAATPVAARSLDVWSKVTRKRAASRALDDLGVPTLAEALRNSGQSGSLLSTALRLPERTAMPETLQVNVGLTCNLACSHCHVESSPSRAETMAPATAERILELLAATPSIRTLDITGGAPEMHSAFPLLVRGARALGVRVIDRCNLTILQRPGMEGMAAFLAEQQVEVVASLPCYSSANVEKQRGEGVFLDSIKSLQQLNALGYGGGGGGQQATGSTVSAAAVGEQAQKRGPRLDLVYNPGGAYLPPSQAQLESDYRAKLAADFGIGFDSLFCIANMPIKRFADELRAEDKLQEYLQLLVSAFNPANLDGIMCRSMVHVAYDGSISDCDFNYALEILPSDPAKRSVFTLKKSFAEISEEPIMFSHHCWGCVAGEGSS